jgi:alkylation response protein AidB-like acyl-CoA dehydrogenase
MIASLARSRPEDRAMDFNFTPAEEAYRQEVRAWLEASVPVWWRNPEVGEDDEDQFERLRTWHQKLYDAGYVGASWPKEYGGAGRTQVENAILQEEMVKMQAPPTVNGLGIGLCGPALIHHGTDAQRARFLRPMLRAEEMWCQGYSEPGAGSDLANVQTRAIRKGDRYVVNGQKIWTSQAHRADWNFCLVRTDPEAPKHGGIGFLLIDMKTPGIEVQPILQINGQRGFSQVFYQDVEVPAENMVGSPTEGWRVANTVLGYERGAGTLSRSAGFERTLRDLIALARERGRTRDPLVRQALAQHAIEVEILRLHGLRQLTALARGERHGPESSIQKVYYSELDQRLTRTGNDLLGPYGQLWRETRRAPEEGRWGSREISARAGSIYSGTNQIQRNIISERVLGLPRR